MKNSALLSVCCALLLTSAHAADSDAPPPAKPLPVALPVLIEAAQAALDTCKASGWPVGITIVDADGAVRSSLRVAGAGVSEC